MNPLRNSFFKIVALLCAVIAASGAAPCFAAERTSFNVAWSIYVDLMPWDFTDQSGILRKWADKYGIKIKLTLPAPGGIDSTALIVGDFSNGNDGVVLKGAGKRLADIKGQKVNLVEL